ncbi:EAL domain-containing protein [Bowmanella sp. JS7-9]|uniref:EAL domain-containing protein n=1 Tax=Pseudobowmanella zhangzhouensis TaxID=1537679 RepID=A0ABW1XS94_9ALTE|nr:EAL domain-containing protein [Bowmanella sp. JS7-9]
MSLWFLVAAVKKTWWILLGLAMVFCTRAEPLMPEQTRPTVKRISTQEGLSQSSVVRLMFDDKGLAWLATDGGLNRYDGYRAKLISAPSEGLTENPIESIVQDAQGRIWIGTGDNGLYVLEQNASAPKSVYRVESPSAPGIMQGTPVLIDYDEQTILVAFTDEVYLLNKQTYDAQRVFILPQSLIDSRNIVRALLPVGEMLYVATSAGLFRVSMQTGEQLFVPHKDHQITEDAANTKSLYMDPEGNLWVGTVKGLYRISAERLTQLFPDRGNGELVVEELNIWRMLPEGDQILLGTNKGFFTYHRSTRKLTYVLRLSDSQYNLSDDDIRDMARDPLGNLWFATRGDGAFLWPRNALQFSTIHKRNDAGALLANDMVTDTLMVEGNKMWVATTAGISLVNLATNRVEYTHVDRDKLYWPELGQGPDGKIWVSAGEGLFLLDPSTDTMQVPITLSGGDEMQLAVWGMHVTPDGNVWFANEHGFFRYEPDKSQVIKLEALTESVSATAAGGFFQAEKDDPYRLYVSMPGRLLVYDTRLGTVDEIHQIQNRQIQQLDYPSRVAEDGFNRLWISYSGQGLVGINKTTGEEVAFYTNETGLPFSTAYDVLSDDNNNLWMSSHAGIIRIDLNSNTVTRYDFSDGLISNEFNAGTGISLSDGRIAFGGVKGITLFNPDDVSAHNNLGNKVVITDVGLLGDSAHRFYDDWNGQLIKLRHDDVGLKVQYSALQYGREGSIQYRYRLRGDEDIEFPVSKDAELIIPRLNPGDYFLDVMQVDPLSKAEGKPSTLRISVAYPVFASPIAYTVYSLVLLAFWWQWRQFKLQQERALQASHLEVTASEERLQLALKASGSGIWDWRDGDNIMYQPRLRDELGYKQDSIAPAEFCELIHPVERPQFENNWNRFLQGELHSFDVTYRLQHSSGEWQWYRDLGRAVENTLDGNIQRISGTFTNITRNIADTEKARLFGEAFSHTRDWVMLLNAEQAPMAVNKAMCTALGIDPEEDLQKQIETCFSATQIRFYLRIIELLGVNDHWQGEQELLTLDNTLHHLMVRINAVPAENSDGDQVGYYVVVMTDISEQKRAQQELETLANYDSLTGLPNRNLILDRIQHAIEHATRRNQRLAALFIDLDRFKQVNDSLGHDAGDFLLLEIARRLKGALRVDDTVGRLAGDEFIVLIEELGDADHLKSLAQKITEEVDRPVDINGNQVSVSASVGIAMYPDHANTPAELIKAADIAMYHSKSAGRNRFCFFTSEMNEEARVRLELESKLKQALSLQQFVNFYQPIVDIDSGKTVGLELLLRWHLDGETISPVRFIPMAEELGLIVPLTFAAIKRGLVDLAQWRQQGFTPYLSVNLSALHLEKGINPAEFDQLLAEHGLTPECLRLEITESALMKDHSQAQVSMEALYDAGYRFSLDDFGTGYSSLRYLKEFPIDTVKIDRSFVSDIGVDASDESIIRTTLLLAESLDMSCVAEGVETLEQVAFFKVNHCPYMQGYLFSKPVPEMDVLALLGRDWNSIINP